MGTQHNQFFMPILCTCAFHLQNIWMETRQKVDDAYYWKSALLGRVHAPLLYPNGLLIRGLWGDPLLSGVTVSTDHLLRVKGKEKETVCLGPFSSKHLLHLLKTSQGLNPAYSPQGHNTFQKCALEKGNGRDTPGWEVITVHDINTRNNEKKTECLDVFKLFIKENQSTILRYSVKK